MEGGGTVTKTQINRWKKLIEYMKQPQEKLRHSEFSFSRISVTLHCRSAGCAMGEFPSIWPAKFPNPWIVQEEICDWLGITLEERDSLFYPSISGISAPWNRKCLTRDATKEDVVEGFENFLDWRKNGPLNED